MKFKAKCTEKYTQVRAKGTTAEMLMALTFVIRHTLLNLVESEEDFEHLKDSLKKGIGLLNYDGTIK